MGFVTYKYQVSCTFDAIILFSVTFPRSRRTCLDACKVEDAAILFSMLFPKSRRTCPDACEVEGRVFLALGSAVGACPLLMLAWNSQACRTYNAMHLPNAPCSNIAVSIQFWHRHWMS